MTDPQRSRTMAAVKSRDTAPERRVASLLEELGIDFQRDVAGLPGRPDFVIPSAPTPLAIFVHGCWWHGHDCPRGARVPKTNRDYWLAKVQRNRRRDRRVTRQLRAAGYSVWIVWECRLRKSGIPTRLVTALRSATLKQ
ncbi:Very short patch repair protein [Planctomycetes bacterium MalM25]|nr:Very short patch repair protein [Planctomycetes bacterium MalM25]